MDPLFIKDEALSYETSMLLKDFMIELILLYLSFKSIRLLI